MTTDDFLDSSDSVRSGQPLRHAQMVTFDQPFDLAGGGRLESVTVCYETYGRLNAGKDNAVLVCHAISGDSHVARHDEDDSPGWWDILVGPGKAIDTDKYFVLCPNILGGCRGTTGPSTINPDTDKPYGPDFPTVTIEDMVEVHRMLLDHLGIETLLAAIGGSLGGHQLLRWSVTYPERIRGAIAVATSARLSSQALAFDVVARNAILHDPNFRDGQYYDGGPTPDVGLAIARMIGHITYISREAMKEKFEADRMNPRDVPTDFEKRFSVGSYLGYQGDKFVERFDANSYITLSLAIDLFDLGGTAEALTASLAASSCRWLVMSFSSDWLFSPSESRQMVDALIRTNKPVSYCNIASSCGHDAFLLPDEANRYGEAVRGFLANLSGDGEAASVPCGEHNPQSIFNPDHPQRLDYDRLLELIPPTASVLDLGCCHGELLARLAERGNAPIAGVELDEQAVIACVCRGLDVVHADLNEGLGAYEDGQFDCVVLSQTLQTIMSVEAVVEDMLRVGRRCIVSFPNFAYHKLRTMLAEQGRAPESPGLLSYKWYNSPNIRCLSIADFEEFVAEKSIQVHRCIALDTEEGREVTDDPNRNADLAIFVISR